MISLAEIHQRYRKLLPVEDHSLGSPVGDTAIPRRWRLELLHTTYLPVYTAITMRAATSPRDGPGRRSQRVSRRVSKACVLFVQCRLHSGNMYSSATVANDVAIKRSDARARILAISVASEMQFAISITRSAFWCLAGKWLHFYIVHLPNL